MGQTAAPKSAPLNGGYFIVTLHSQRHRVALEVEVENTFKKPHNLSRLLPSLTPFFLQFLYFFPPHIRCTHEGGLLALKSCEIWEKCEKTCTWKPLKSTRSRPRLWSKTGAISSDVKRSHGSHPTCMTLKPKHLTHSTSPFYSHLLWVFKAD